MAATSISVELYRLTRKLYICFHVTPPEDRFKNGSVRNIFILSYVNRVSYEDPDEVCLDTALRRVRFLEQFPDLEYLMFGGFLPDPLQEDDDGRLVQTYSLIPYDPHRISNRLRSDFQKQIHRGLLCRLASAFSFGLLPANIRIENMQMDLDVAEEDRAVCTAVCQTFPVHQFFLASVKVLGDDTCITPETFIDILSKRQGGLDFLRDPKRYLDIFPPSLEGMHFIPLLSGAGCDPMIAMF